MNRQHDRGSLSMEALILTPVLMMLILMIVTAWRTTDATFRVQRAADIGARVASQSNSVSMVARGQNAARNDLARNLQSCSETMVAVRTQNLGKFQTVTATVTCLVDHSGLGLLALSRRSITASSTEVVDFYTNR